MKRYVTLMIGAIGGLLTACTSTAPNCQKQGYYEQLQLEKTIPYRYESEGHHFVLEIPEWCLTIKTQNLEEAFGITPEEYSTLGDQILLDKHLDRVREEKQAGISIKDNMLFLPHDEVFDKVPYLTIYDKDPQEDLSSVPELATVLDNEHCLLSPAGNGIWSWSEACPEHLGMKGNFDQRYADHLYMSPTFPSRYITKKPDLSGASSLFNAWIVL